MAEAEDGGAILNEFRAAGFGDAKILRTSRNARTKTRSVVAADVTERK